MVKVVRIQSRICTGGPAFHSILLTEALSYGQGARYDTHLLGGGLEPGEASMADFAHARGVSFQVIEEMNRPIHPLRDGVALGKLIAALRRLRPTIVHTHTAKAGALGRIAARIVGVPIVLHTFHGHVFEGYFGRAKTNAILATERALGAITDRILVLSDQQKSEIIDRYKIASPQRVQVIPLGLDLDRFRRTKFESRGGFRRELGIEPNTPLVVSAGRLVPIKRFDLLIDAFRRVLDRIPSACLAIVGDGEPGYRAELENLAAPVRSAIRFLGWRTDLESMYLDADVAALTSDNEGTPVALIEAICAGTFVVATSVGGVPEVVGGDAGVLVPRGDVAAFSNALTDALRVPRRVSDSTRDATLERFSHHRLVSDMTRLYDTLVDELPARKRRLGRRIGADAPC